MDDLREILERDLSRVGPAAFDFDRLARKRDGVRRKQRVGAGIAGLAILTALIGLLTTILRAGETSEPVTTPVERTNGWIVYSILYSDRVRDDVVGGLPEGVYVARPGMDAKRIVGAEGDGAQEYCPSFSPDGSLLSYTEATYPTRPFSDVEIVVTAVDESALPIGDVRRIAVPPMEEPRLLCAQWSPDGTALAYADSGLWVTPIGGGDARRLSGEGPRFFAWSPDGSTIAANSGADVSLISVDDGEVRTVADTPGGVVSWSPDGGAVAVGQDDSDGRNPGILVIDAERGTVRPLSLGPRVSGGNPHWSPDGEQIAFVDEGTIHLIDPEGGPVVTLPDVVLPGLEAAPLGIWDVDWSPDGRRLLTLGHVRAPESYVLVSIAADGLADPVRISPLDFAFYFTASSDIDWQGVPT